MKIYKFTASGVLVDGQPLALKRHSSESGHYVSPIRIALSILVDCVGDAAAMLHAAEFQREIVDHCKVGDGISADEVQEWNGFKCQVGASVQSAIWTKDATEPQAVNVQPWRLPRLLRVQRR